MNFYLYGRVVHDTPGIGQGREQRSRQAWMRKRILFLGLIYLFSGCANVSRAPSSSAVDAKDYQRLLEDSLRLYSRELRNQSTGQYYDALPLDKEKGKDFNSSVAATGMGLIALALSDALNTETDARNKALLTLRALNGSLQNRSFRSVRSKSGWFRHWFDSRDGKNNGGSVADGFSTIDTAILVAGAQLAANYFAESGKDESGELAQLADALLLSVDWNTAVSNLEKGDLYLNFDLGTEQPKASTSVFNEYVIVACMGEAASKREKGYEKIDQFWNKHFKDPSQLPRKKYDEIELLTDHPSHFLSSFTMQFASYLCGYVGKRDEFREYLSNAQKADRRWFSKIPGSKYFWGLGAGESFSAYHADSIGDNPGQMVSPHIIAGFLPVYPDGMRDLLSIYRDKSCLNTYGDYQFLWRCSLEHPEKRVERLQAIDFSSMFLGLSSFHPKIGFDFFLRNSAH